MNDIATSCCPDPNMPVKSKACVRPALCKAVTDCGPPCWLPSTQTMNCGLPCHRSALRFSTRVSSDGGGLPPPCETALPEPAPKYFPQAAASSGLLAPGP